MKNWTLVGVALIFLLMLWFRPFREGLETRTPEERSIDAENRSRTASTRSGYADVLTSMGQSTGYGTVPSPSGGTGNQAPVGDGTGNQIPVGGGTEPQLPSDGSSTSVMGSNSGGGGIPGMPTGGARPATTTGGSSTSVMGSNSGGGGDRRNQVFGPLFTSIGDGGDNGEDTSKNNVYPQLIGGGPSKKSTRIDGVGIVTPTAGGGLPTSAGLGSDENSRFLPTSRTPGDMELIPDPYRVSQSYSAANYSFKTDPVPFLTDFSAFQK